MYRYLKKERYSDEENPYWISFSDAISGILMIFILVTIYLMYSIGVQEKTAHEMMNDDIEQMQKEFQEQGIRVEVDDSVIRIPYTTMHFETNKTIIPEIHRIDIEKIGLKIIHYVTEVNKNIDTVFIEGHTDCRPSLRDHRGNLGLSTDRAISVAKSWANVREDFWEIKNQLGKPLFSVSGYGEMRPISGTMLGKCSEESEENLERNRRIDIRFVLGRPKIKDIESLRNVR